MGNQNQPASAEEEQGRGWAVCSPDLVIAGCVCCTLEVPIGMEM